VIDDVALPRVAKYKYPGHVISEDLKDDDDRKYRKIDAQGNSLFRKFHMCNEAAKITLLRSFCTVMYSCQLWWNYTFEFIKKLCCV